MYVVDGSPIISRHHRRDSHSTNSDDTENSSHIKPNLTAIQTLSPTPSTPRITAPNNRMDFQQFVRLEYYSIGHKHVLACMYTLMCACVYVCMYACMYVCVYVYILY